MDTIGAKVCLGISRHSQKFTFGGKAFLAQDSKHPHNRAHQINGGANHG